MKHKNVQVGQHVIIKRSASAVWNKAADHIGEEFRVVAVEDLDYEGEATVRVELVIRKVPFLAEFWCNHRDLKRVKEEAPRPAPRPFKVGDKVRIITNHDGMFPVGTIGTVTAAGVAEDYLPFLVETKDDFWHYDGCDLELYVEKSAPAKLPWPWPKGTPVELTDEGRAHVERFLRLRGLPLDTPLFLGSDGSDLPPVETADGQYISYVKDTYVKRK